MDAKTIIAKRQNSATKLAEAGPEESTASLRLCYIKSDSDGNLGLHLSRTPWDPYPWISGVTPGSNAEAAGVKTGDCVLEVNGEDLLGQRIMDVAKKVRREDSANEGVTLLLWNSGYEKNVKKIKK
jgi:C-terminal processing protease CtpA/Prc